MEHQSILDHSSAPPEVKAPPANLPLSNQKPRPESSSVSARIAAANARLAMSSDRSPRFPGEDAGRSLAQMAERDLDAALQLLADRAQYITGSSGAAIALRRGEHHDMLCRATVGANAPELGALLSMEYGLSGESVRTRQVLRCDDAELDPRVNREVCRELGIASVVVMPIMKDKQVLGVFELLSGKTKAFDDRDLSALLRLSEMVHIAVSHAVAAQIVPLDPPEQVSEPQTKFVTTENPKIQSSEAPQSAAPKPEASQLEVAQSEVKNSLVPAAAVSTNPIPVPTPEIPSPKLQEPAPASKKLMFWSAAMRAQSAARPEPLAETSAVPPMLRNLQKCQACGFPVSQGRSFCVECEEKQWRNQPASRPTGKQTTKQPAPSQSKPTLAIGEVKTILVSPEIPAEIPVPAAESVIAAVPVSAAAVAEKQSVTATVISSQTATAEPAPATTELSTVLSVSENPTPFLSSAMPTESWLAANKFVLGALLLVAIIIGVIAWLR